MTKIKPAKSYREKNPNYDVDFKIWVLLDHARGIISRSRELELAQYGLTPEQAAILRTLLSSPKPLTIAEISDETNRQYNSVTTLVNRMNKANLVTKVKSNQNKKYLISITAEGKNKYLKVKKRSIRMAFSNLKAEDKQKLAYYLEELIKKGREILRIDEKLPFLN